MYNNLSFSSLELQESKTPILVKYAGLDIAKITGPSPLVDLSTTFNTNALGIAESVTYSITLTGKIIRKAYDEKVESTTDVVICNNTKPIPAGDGIKGIVAAIKVLTDHLKNCPIGTFVIECGPGSAESTKLYEAPNARVTGFSFDKGNNQWTQASDYTINLEYMEAIDPKDPPVTEMNDNWSIEPLDDITYEIFAENVQQVSEWDNPNLKPTAATINSKQFAPSINVTNIPQFRITRSVGAKGIPVAGTGISGICITGAGAIGSSIMKYNHTAFAGAKEWVDKQLTNSFMGTKFKPSGILYFSNTANNLIADKMFLYNHTRTTNIDIYGGRYEVNDSWIVLPTGLAYTEEYNIDISTSEEFTKTVRVAGTIKGFALHNIDVMQGSGLLQGVVVPTGADTNNFNGSLSVTGLLKLSESVSSAPPANIGDIIPKIPGTLKLEASKYQNANSGWIYNIKPYLYRRASLGMNSIADRKKDVLPPSQRLKGPSNNPIYCKEGLLYPIPRATTEGHDPKRGIITYSYEYTNSMKLITGVLSENISITNDAPTDVFSETQIIGRQLGPILNLSGKTSARKSVSIEVIVAKPARVEEMWPSNIECPLWTGGYVYNTIGRIIEGVKPFGLADARDNNLWGGQYVVNPGSSLTPKSRSQLRPGIVYVSSDQESWNPTNGRYSRSVSWTYQQCDNEIMHMDH